MESYSIVAGYAAIGQGAGPLIVTQLAGLFAKHGLDVEIRLMHGGKAVVKGLMDGEIRFGNLAAATADPRQFVDDRFIKELEESGFIQELYGRR